MLDTLTHRSYGYCPGMNVLARGAVADHQIMVTVMRNDHIVYYSMVLLKDWQRDDDSFLVTV